jgi:RNA polymerase sigma-70 factor (ECF subfamily)
MDSPEDNRESIRIADIARLLIEHRASLMGYLVSCVRNHTDAEDLFQDVSLTAIQSADQLRTADGFLPWTREIARRRVLAHFRKSKRLTPVDPELVDRLTETAAEMNSSHEAPARIEALYSCLEALPGESRKLIALRYEDHQRPVESLAESIGRSVQATYAILKRSRLLLRNCITQKMEGPPIP